LLYFDLETTGLDYGSALNAKNRVLMVSYAEDDGPVRTYVGDIMQAIGFWQALARHDDACAYYAKFEMHWLKRCGFDIDSKDWHDPMLAEKVLLGNTRMPMGLGDVAARYGYTAKDKMIDSMMKAGICPSEMPQRRLRARCVRDVRTMRSVMKDQLELLQ
jgi:hypothetical protein